MNTYQRRLRASISFPVKLGEAFTVRDGRGRTAEHWTLVDLQVGKSHQWLTYAITDYGLITTRDDLAA